MVCWRDRRNWISGRRSRSSYAETKDVPVRNGALALREVAALVLGDQQFVLRVDERLAAVIGELVLLLEVDGVFGAGLFAHPAEDAAQHVDLVSAGVAFPVRLGIVGRILGSLHEDRVGRAGHRAELTTHATLEAVAMAGEDVEPAEAREHLQLLVGILDGEGLLEEVLKRNP